MDKGREKRKKLMVGGRRKGPVPRPLSFYLVIDFEATCEEASSNDSTNGASYPCEIIEFPCIALCAYTLQVVGEFHTYVRPLIQPQLSPFCRRLTGIAQKEVTGAPDIHEAVLRFSTWVDETLHVPDPRAIAVVCDGPCDIGKFLHTHILRDGLKVPKYLRRWCDVRQLYRSVLGQSPRGSLRDIVESLGLPFVGRQHSGLDDARNIANVVVALKGRGGEIVLHGALP